MEREQTVDVRRAGERAHTGISWLDSRHSFSFGRHYDPQNTHFGLLLVNNDDVVRAGTGFETHPHRDMEIVTWVLDGSLVHQDSAGNSGVIYPGLAQRMSAGSGILHSEKNDSWRIGGERHDRDVHFVQMWVTPDETGAGPGYEQLDITRELDAGELVVVASGMPVHRERRAIGIRQRGAALHAARLAPGAGTPLPDSAFAHLFVARGSVGLEGGGALGTGDLGTGDLGTGALGTGDLGTGDLGTGDAARVTGSQGRRVTAGSAGAEILIWQMADGLRR